jgi:hypothetical protein
MDFLCSLIAIGLAMYIIAEFYVEFFNIRHSRALPAFLIAGCILCSLSIVHTVERTYRQGYVGSFAMMAKVVYESGAELIVSKPEPAHYIRLSDLSTVKPSKGGVR